MPYRRDNAAQTVIAVAGALRANWAALGAGAQQAIRQIITRLGPEIYGEAGYNRAGRVVALLEAIAAIPGLPGPVLDALKLGEGTSGGLTKVSDAERDRALDALRTVHDARRYADAIALADILRLEIAMKYRGLDAETRARWEALDRAYAAGGSATAYLDAVNALLGERLPFVREAIEAGKTWSDAVYRSAALPKSPLEYAPPDMAAPDLLPLPREPDLAFPDTSLRRERPSDTEKTPPDAPAIVQRFANVYFPAVVHRAQQSIPLIIHIATNAAEGTVTVSAGSAQMKVAVGELSIFVHAEDFETQYGLGGAEIPPIPFGATVAVRPSGDSEPVIFFLTPKAPGAKRISIEFYQGRKPVGSLTFGVNVVEQFAQGATVGRVQVAPVALLSAEAADAVPPALELRVIGLGDGLSYDFVLTSADGAYNQTKLGRISLKSDPRGYFKTVTDELSTLAKVEAGERTAEEDEAARRRLEELGARLWDELLPRDFKTEYRAGRLDPYKGQGFVITSDEPWIPWEMVRPFEADRDGTVYSDPPLCELFRLTRWLSDNGGAPSRLTIKRGVVVAPRGDLASVQEEVDYFKQMSARGGAGEWIAPVVSTAAVRHEMAQGEAQVFHFSCHGNFQYDDADESRLKLEDGFLKPSNIRYARELALGKAAPLVFLNACHAGRVGMTVTRMGGWAESFIRRGATAFVGSLWEINDKLAAMFAREFYDRLWGLGGQQPQTIGEAFYAARMALKAADEANPTWLAYVLYADPNGRVGFGG